MYLFDRWRRVPVYGIRRGAIERVVRSLSRELGKRPRVVSRRAATGGWFLYRIGQVLLVAGMALAVYALTTQSEDQSFVDFLIGPFGLGALLALAGSFPHKRGKRLLHPSATELRAVDKRKPVLLLRSFRDEDAQIVSAVSEKGQIAKTRLEEGVADQLALYGPLIAIGRPGEPLPTLGAARNYYSDADWQEAVSAWTREALLIVVILGTTPGLMWELDTIRSRGHLSKLLLLMHPETDFRPGAVRSGSGSSLTRGGTLNWGWSLSSARAQRYIFGGEYDFSAWKWRSTREIEATRLANRARLWENLRAAFAAVPAFSEMPEKFPDGLVAMHLGHDGSLVLLAGGDLAKEKDYERAIRFAVYGMLCHGREGTAA